MTFEANKRFSMGNLEGRTKENLEKVYSYPNFLMRFFTNGEIMSKKAKQKKNQKESEKAAKQKSNLERLLLAKPIPFRTKYLLLFGSIAIILLIGIYFLPSSHAQNGFWGFPLDDPWIHLTFAKNLIDYGSFSYFKNEIVTSGSTSPIYTLLLAALFLLSSNEFIISYTLGGFFSAITIFFIFKLFAKHFKSFPWLGAAAILFVTIQPKLNLISVSGMETTMFIAFLTMVFYFYITKNMIWLGISLGLTIWCRPDGFVIWLALIIDYIVQTKFLKPQDTKSETVFWERKKFLLSFVMAGVLILLYFGFNFLLSGEFLPNTYRAKLEYYQNNERSYFLTTEVLKYFSSKEFILIWIPFLIGFIIVLFDLIKKRRNNFLVYFLFVLGLIAAYYLMLPFSHRFGRYLMPVIPFYILTSFYGIKTVFEFALRKNTSVGIINFLFIVFVLTGIFLSLKEINTNRDEYTELCKYHNDRHVAAGRWLKNNTQENAVIAAHDVGAIAYYSQRKIVDMIGLVTPEIISHINDKDYSSFLNNYFAQNKIDYLVTLRNWFEVVNDNPVFIPVNQFEFLEIFKYKAGKTHITPKQATQMNEQAIQVFQQNSPVVAEQILQQSLNVDPSSSRTLFLLGAIAENKKDFLNAESFFEKAIRIFPEYADANFGLARIKYNQRKYLEAMKNINRCLSVKPDYNPALDLMALIKSKI